MQGMCLNDTATTEIYTLSLHDALPIFRSRSRPGVRDAAGNADRRVERASSRARADRRPRWRRADRLPYLSTQDRKSTRLNSSHANISYAVFCLKQSRFTLQSGWGKTEE